MYLNPYLLDYYDIIFFRDRGGSALICHNQPAESGIVRLQSTYSTNLTSLK